MMRGSLTAAPTRLLPVIKMPLLKEREDRSVGERLDEGNL